MCRPSCHHVWRWVIVPPDFFVEARQASMSCISCVDLNHASIMVISGESRGNDNVRRSHQIRRYNNSPPYMMVNMIPDSPFKFLDWGWMLERVGKDGWWEYCWVLYTILYLGYHLDNLIILWPHFLICCLIQLLGTMKQALIFFSLNLGALRLLDKVIKKKVTFVSKALWYRTFKKLDCSLIWNLYTMYQSIHSSNCGNFMNIFIMIKY